MTISMSSTMVMVLMVTLVEEHGVVSAEDVMEVLMVEMERMDPMDLVERGQERMCQVTSLTTMC